MSPEYSCGLKWVSVARVNPEDPFLDPETLRRLREAMRITPSTTEAIRRAMQVDPSVFALPRPMFNIESLRLKTETMAATREATRVDLAPLIAQTQANREAALEALRSVGPGSLSTWLQASPQINWDVAAATRRVLAQQLADPADADYELTPEVSPTDAEAPGSRGTYSRASRRPLPAAPRRPKA